MRLSALLAALLVVTIAFVSSAPVQATDYGVQRVVVRGYNQAVLQQVIQPQAVVYANAGYGHAQQVVQVRAIRTPVLYQQNYAQQVVVQRQVQPVYIQRQNFGYGNQAIILQQRNNFGFNRFSGGSSFGFNRFRGGGSSFSLRFRN